MKGKKKIHFVSSPAIFYDDFPVIPPRGWNKARPLGLGGDVTSCSAAAGLGQPRCSAGAAQPSLRCSVDFLARRALLACWVCSPSCGRGLLFFFPPSLPSSSPFLVNVCSGRERGEVGCDGQRAVVPVLAKLMLWSTSF